MFRFIGPIAIVGWMCSVCVAQDRALFAQSRYDPVIDAGVSLAFDQAANDTIGAWVFFTDKRIRTVAQFEAAEAAADTRCSERARRRRSMRRTAPGMFDHYDFPLAESYVRGALATGASLRTKSEWLNAISVNATRAQIDAMAALPYVRLVKPLARSVRIDPLTKPLVVEAGPRAAGPGFYGAATDQLQQINIPAAHAAGYTGAGIIIGILDTGFKRTHEAFNEPGNVVNVLGEWDFVNNDGNTGPEAGDPSSQHTHGTLILGTIGAYKPNTLVGGAYDASFYLAKTENVASETPIEEDFYVAGLQWLETNGADLATSSLGYIDWYTQADLDGATAVTTLAVNIATANGLVCCTAAGNSGHDSNPATSRLIAPADALDVLTCGANQADGTISGFSSDGPTADGRVKPEVLARGSGTATVDPNVDTNYTTASGTSLSTPLVASAVALVLQAHPDWTVRQVRTALQRTASDYVANQTFDPLYVRGYGIIDVMAAIGVSFKGDFDGDADVDSADLAQFIACFTGPGGGPVGAPCLPGDFDGDLDVDCDDWTQFQLAWTEVTPPSTMPPACQVAVPGDFDGDGDVDTADLTAFINCFTGPGGGPIGPPCQPGDFDGDLDIDCGDWAQFQQAWTAPGSPPASPPTCRNPVPLADQWAYFHVALLMLIVATATIRGARSTSSA